MWPKQGFSVDFSCNRIFSPLRETPQREIDKWYLRLKATLRHLKPIWALMSCAELTLFTACCFPNMFWHSPPVRRCDDVCRPLGWRVIAVFFSSVPGCWLLQCQERKLKPPLSFYHHSDKTGWLLAATKWEYAVRLCSGWLRDKTENYGCRLLLNLINVYKNKEIKTWSIINLLVAFLIVNIKCWRRCCAKKDLLELFLQHSHFIVLLDLL